MFERLQKPFLTVETGEAYQPDGSDVAYDILATKYIIGGFDKSSNALNQKQSGGSRVENISFGVMNVMICISNP